MMNSADNELLTRIGPGTPMGAMLREYWVPACRSARLEADGAPERIRLFGENFVAFRATDGRVGFMQEACPHRRASLALARNEDNGLRCVFHGWKFSVEGHCVDAPTEPREQRERFAESVPVRCPGSPELAAGPGQFADFPTDQQFDQTGGGRIGLGEQIPQDAGHPLAQPDPDIGRIGPFVGLGEQPAAAVTRPTRRRPTDRRDRTVEQGSGRQHRHGAADVPAERC